MSYGWWLKNKAKKKQDHEDHFIHSSFQHTPSPRLGKEIKRCQCGAEFVVYSYRRVKQKQCEKCKGEENVTK